MRSFEKLCAKLFADAKCAKVQADPCFKMQAVEGKDGLEILLHGVVGDEYNALSSLDVAKLITTTDAEITIRINSPGGLVYDGLAIAAALAVHSRPTTSIVEGVAASAAAIISQATDRRVAHESSQFMIHRSWGMNAGNADAMRDMATQLDKIDQQLIALFADRTGQPADVLDRWMRGEVDGTWFTAQEAFGAGFFDEVIPNKRRGNLASKAKAAQSLQISINNRLLELDAWQN